MFIFTKRAYIHGHNANPDGGTYAGASRQGLFRVLCAVGHGKYGILFVRSVAKQFEDAEITHLKARIRELETALAHTEITT